MDEERVPSRDDLRHRRERVEGSVWLKDSCNLKERNQENEYVSRLFGSLRAREGESACVRRRE